MLKNDYPLSRCCAVLSLARSAYYYRAVPPAETQLLAAIEQIGAQFPTYGTRRMREQVKREQPALAMRTGRRLNQLPSPVLDSCWVAPLYYVHLGASQRTSVADLTVAYFRERWDEFGVV